jgi:hypothetical protein
MLPNDIAISDDAARLSDETFLKIDAALKLNIQWWRDEEDLQAALLNRER